MLESQLQSAESNHNHSFEVLKSTRANHLSNYPHLCHEVADLTDDENTDCKARAITQHARLQNLVIVQDNIAKTKAQLREAFQIRKNCHQKFSIAAKKDADENGHGRVYRAFEEVLARHHIKSAVWFGGTTTLQGASSKKLLSGATEYMRDMQQVLVNCLSVDATAEQIELHKNCMTRWEIFRNLFTDAMLSASTIFNLTESVSMLTKNEGEQLRKETAKFDALIKELKWGQCPKFHMIGSHLADKVIASGTFGLFSESIVERVHYVYNLYRTRTHNTSNFEKNERKSQKLMCLNFLNSDVYHATLRITNPPRKRGFTASSATDTKEVFKKIKLEQIHQLQTYAMASGTDFDIMKGKLSMNIVDLTGN